MTARLLLQFVDSIDAVRVRFFPPQSFPSKNAIDDDRRLKVRRKTSDRLRVSFLRLKDVVVRRTHAPKQSHSLTQTTCIIIIHERARGDDTRALILSFFYLATSRFFFFIRSFLVHCSEMVLKPPRAASASHRLTSAHFPFYVRLVLGNSSCAI